MKNKLLTLLWVLILALGLAQGLALAQDLGTDSEISEFEMTLALPPVGPDGAYDRAEGVSVVVGFQPAFNALDRYELHWWTDNEDIVDEDSDWGYDAWDRCFEEGETTKAEIPLNFNTTQDACVKLTVGLYDPIAKDYVRTDAVTFWITQGGVAPAATAQIAAKQGAWTLYGEMSAIDPIGLFTYSQSDGTPTSGKDVEIFYCDANDREYDREAPLYHYGGGSKWYIPHDRGEALEVTACARSKTNPNVQAEMTLNILPRSECPYYFEFVEGRIPRAMVAIAEDDPDEIKASKHAQCALVLRREGEGQPVSLAGLTLDPNFANYGMNAIPKIEDDRIVLDLYPDSWASPIARAGVLLHVPDEDAPLMTYGDVNVLASGFVLPFTGLVQPGPDALNDWEWWLGADERLEITLVPADQNDEPIDGVDLNEYEVHVEAHNGADVEGAVSADGSCIELDAAFPVDGGFDVRVSPKGEDPDMCFAQYSYWPWVLDAQNPPDDMSADPQFATDQGVTDRGSSLFAPVGTSGFEIDPRLTIGGDDGRRMTQGAFDAVVEHIGYTVVGGDPLEEEEPGAWRAKQPGIAVPYTELTDGQEFTGKPLFVYNDALLEPRDDVIEIEVPVGQRASLAAALGGFDPLHEIVLNELLEMRQIDEHFALSVPSEALELVGVQETVDPQGNPWDMEGALCYRDDVSGREPGAEFARVLVRVVAGTGEPLIQKYGQGKDAAVPSANAQSSTSFKVATLTNAGQALTLDHIRVSMDGCSHLRGVAMDGNDVVVTVWPADHLCLSRIVVVADNGTYTTALTHYLVVEPDGFVPPVITASVEDGSHHAPGDVVTLVATWPGDVDLMCRYRIRCDLDGDGESAVDWNYTNDWDWDNYEPGRLALNVVFAAPTLTNAKIYLQDPVNWETVSSGCVPLVIMEEALVPATAIATAYDAGNPLTLYAYTNAIKLDKLFTIAPQDANDVVYAIAQGEGAVELLDGWVCALDVGPAQVTATSFANPAINATAYILVEDGAGSEDHYWFDIKDVPGAMAFGEGKQATVTLYNRVAGEDLVVDLSDYELFVSYGGFAAFTAQKSNQVGGIDLDMTAPANGEDTDYGWISLYVEQDGFGICNISQSVAFMDDVPFSKFVLQNDDRPVAGKDYVLKLKPTGGSLDAGKDWPEGVTIAVADAEHVTHGECTWDKDAGVIQCTLNYPVSGKDNVLLIVARLASGREIATYWLNSDVQQPIVDLTIALAPGDLTYNHLPQQPAVTAMDGQKTLAEGVDYVVDYKDNVNATTDDKMALAVVTGVGDYQGIKELPFAIAPKSLDNAIIEKIPDQLWTGEPIAPAIVVSDGVTLVEGTDYDVAYPAASTAVGKGYGVTVTGKGNYTGTATASFNIVALAQAAPSGVQGVAPSVKGKPDGKLTGLTAEMEYKAQGARDYTAAGGNEAAGLSAGAYLVRVQAKDGHLPSPDASVTIPEGEATFTVTFNPGYEGGPVSSVGGLGWNATVTPPVLARQGYALAGWYDAAQAGNPWTGETQVQRDMTLYARWTAKTVKYMVEHYQEGLSGGYVLESAVEASGLVGAQTGAAAQSYTGFTAQPIQQQMIAPDGTTAVKVYYDRDSHQLKFVTDTGVTLLDTQVKYGMPINPPSVRVPGRIFVKWEPDVPQAMPDAGVTYTARTQAATTAYTVEHYRQNLDKTDYVLYQTESVSGPADATAALLAAAAQKKYDGFAHVNASAAITGATLKLYYDRNSYAWTLGTDANSKIKTDGSTASGTLAYGSAVTVNADWVNDSDANGYDWLGWHSSDENLLASSPNAQYAFKMPAGQVSLTPTIRAKSFGVVFDANGGSGGGSVVATYGQTIDADMMPNPTRAGYTFGGWYDGDDEVTHVSSGATLYAHWTPANNTPFTVEHYQQSLDGGYVLVGDDTTHPTGTTGENAAVTPNSYYGFGEGRYEPTPIAADGSTVVKVYYDRLAYDLTFKLYQGADPIVLTGVKFGAPIAPPVVTRPGYVLSGWSPNVDAAMPPANSTYTAQWDAADDTPYLVKHYWKDAQGEGRALVLTEQFRGTTGTNVTPSAKAYTGFTAPNVQPQIIGAAGDTVFELVYARKECALIFDTANGDAAVTRTLPYGAPIDPPTPTRDGYTFVGWKPAVPATMPAVDSTYTAQWTAGSTVYTVQHYWEDLDGAGYTLAKTETLADVTGALVAATPQRFEGFSYAKGLEGEVPSGAVAADGSLTLKLYYQRKHYNLTFDGAGGTGSATQLVAYGAPVTKADPDRPGYRFAGWTPQKPTAMPAADVTCTATWTAVECNYQVNHYREGLDGQYALYTQQGRGNAGLVAQASPQNYPGFTYLPGRSTATGVIQADGQLVLEMYYARNRYLATFDANGGTGGTGSQLLYEEPIPAPAVSRMGYTFGGWDQTVPATMPAGNRTFKAKWTPNPNTPYVVEHYLENLDGSWPGAPSASETKAGATGATITGDAARRAYEGFTDLNMAKTAATATIAADGSTVYKLYYTRDVYTLSFDTDGNGTPDLTIQVKYGSLISRQINAVSKAIGDAQATGVTVPMPIKDDMLFNGWRVNNIGGEGTIPAKVTGDLALTAIYVNQSGMSEYLVEHYVMGVLRETDTRYAKAGDVATYAFNDYPGYEFIGATNNQKAPGAGKVAADGSLRVQLNYGMALYPVTVDWNGAQGTIIGVSPSSGSFAQGTSVTVSVTTPPDGYAIAGWESLNANLPGSADAAYTFTMPQGDVSLKLKRTPQTYTIAYPAGMSGPTAYTFGTARSLPTPASPDPGKVFAGWRLDTTGKLYTEIPADFFGNVTLAAVFKAQVTLTFDANQGAFAGGATQYKVTGLEGDAVPAIPTPTRAGYSFGGWSPSLPTAYPGADASYTAQWNQGGGAPGPVPAIPATGAKLPSASLTVEAGKTAAIQVVLEPADANDYQITWRSLDPSIATVDANGVVTGVAPGEAAIAITVQSGGNTFALELKVTVEEAGDGPDDPDDPDDPVTIDTVIDLLAIAKGKTFALPKFRGAAVSWAVGDETVALVKGGKIKGLQLGETTLTMTVESVAKKAALLDGHKLKAGQRYTIDLKVRQKGELATKVAVSQKKAALNLTDNTTLKLTATAGPAKKVLDKKIFWASKDPSIATVDAHGKVTAVKPGKTEIYAYSANLKRAKVTVQVAGLVTGVKIVDQEGKVLKKASLGVDEQLKLSVQVNEDAVNKQVTWSSGKKGIATVAPDGTVTAHKKGKVVITAKADDGSGKKAKITITVK